MFLQRPGFKSPTVEENRVNDQLISSPNIVRFFSVLINAGSLAFSLTSQFMRRPAAIIVGGWPVEVWEASAVFVILKSERLSFVYKSWLDIPVPCSTWVSTDVNYSVRQLNDIYMNVNKWHLKKEKINDI